MQIEIPPISHIVTESDDWRKAKGKQYSLRSLFLVCILGLLSGKRGLRSMARYGKGLPQGSKKRLGITNGKGPSAATLCRFCWYMPVDELEQRLVAWAQQVHERLVEAGLSQGIAIDGKTVRRAASLGAVNVHLLSAVCHQVRLVLGQVAVDDKTNEITAIHPLLERILLKGMVITVDALLTQRKICQEIRRHQGHYLMFVKENQPKTYEALWQLFERPRRFGVAEFSTAYTLEKGHGRVEKRQIWVSSALNDYLDWPELAQVFKLTRTVLHPKSGKHSCESVFGMTSLGQQTAAPNDLLSHIRHHWAAIENGLHWVRDVVLGEDASRVHKATAPQTLAALRNLAISVARLAGFDSFSAAVDAFQADHHKALHLLAV